MLCTLGLSQLSAVCSRTHGPCADCRVLGIVRLYSYGLYSLGPYCIVAVSHSSLHQAFDKGLGQERDPHEMQTSEEILRDARFRLTNKEMLTDTILDAHFDAIQEQACAKNLSIHFISSKVWATFSNAATSAKGLRVSHTKFARYCQKNNLELNPQAGSRCTELYVRVHEGPTLAGHFSGFVYQPQSFDMTFCDSREKQEQIRNVANRHRSVLLALLTRRSPLYDDAFSSASIHVRLRRLPAQPIQTDYVSCGVFQSETFRLLIEERLPNGGVDFSQPGRKIVSEHGMSLARSQMLEVLEKHLSKKPSQPSKECPSGLPGTDQYSPITSSARRSWQCMHGYEKSACSMCSLVRNSDPFLTPNSHTKLVSPTSQTRVESSPARSTFTSAALALFSLCWPL